tara:strand:+ start:434 stop:1747 length:1314 start_codon:yes stop_codon:yes gene_type:complete
MGGRIRVLKNVGGGLRGSTSGLRFNPREAPEFTEEDRNMGRDDPESKERHDEKKRKEKEIREKKIHGLHHLNLKIPKRRSAQGDNQRNDGELSEMTGPASSTGYPLDVASGAKTGGGSAMGGPNIMTGPVLDISGDTIQKRELSRARSGIKTIEHKLQSDRHKKTTKHRKTKGLDVIQARNNSKTALNVHGTRHPERATRYRFGISKRTRTSKGLPKNPTLTRSRHRSGKNLLWMQANPQKRLLKTHRSQASRMGVTSLPYTIPTPYGAGGSLGTGSGNTFATLNKASKRNPALHGPTILRGPKQPQVKGGMQQLTAPAQTTTSPIATASPIASPIAQSYDDISPYLEGVMLKGPLSGADVTELKMLIRELRRLLRSGGLRKSGLEDSEHDDERPTPNAHKLTTSSPTGATEVDPDEDPRFWGAHPIGLLAPRRGHM